MIIGDLKTRDSNPTLDEMQPRPGDKINMLKFNRLPSPVTARLFGGGEYWIEMLDVQTGAMRIDVCGQIDRLHFSDVRMLIDIEGQEHDPDDFWLEDELATEGMQDL